jgi:type IV secretory pathway component VirB8
MTTSSIIRPQEDSQYEDSTSSRRARSRGAPNDYLARAGNAPASLYDDAANKFAEIWGSSRVQAARWFMVALACIVLSIVCVITTASLFPLKEIRPWFVEYNTSTGIVNRPVEIVQVDPNIAVVKAELARWVEAVYTIDPLRSSELLRWANVRAADKAITQFAEFRTRERIFERIRKEPEMVRQVKVTAVEASKKGTAFVYVTTTERVGVSEPSPDKIHKYRVTLNYKLVPQTQEADLLANPLGLFVTYFADAEERSL